jgi:hypothetical protein
VSDPAEDIAAAVAEYLADPARAFVMAAAVSVPENLWTNLFAEDTTLRVLIGPAGETEEKETRSQVLLRPEVDVVVVGTTANPGDRRRLSDFVYSIRSVLRFERMNNWIWTKTETTDKFNVEALKMGVFLSSFRLTYSGII